MPDAKLLQLSARQVRLLSIVALVIMLFGSGLLFGTVSGHDGAGFTIVSVLGWLLAFLITVGRPGWRPPRRGELDEREQSDRTWALVISHRVTGIILGLCFIYVLPGARIGWWLPNAEQASWLLGAIFWLHLMLPATLLAWRDRDVDGQD